MENKPDDLREIPDPSRPASAESPAAAPSANDEPRDPYSPFRIPAYRRYAMGNIVSVIGRQMLDVAVGWEVFQRTNSAAMLGYVGLAAAIPIILFALPAGHLADRVSRKTILLINQLVTSLMSIGLALVSLTHAPIGWMFLLLFISATSRAFGWTARAALVPNLVPAEIYSKAVTWNTGMFQTGSMVGPAVSGFLIHFFGYPVVYFLDATCALTFFSLLWTIHPRVEMQKKTVRESIWRELFSGIRFVKMQKVILATITLDLFAVLLGGATALLPIFARDILHCGAIGLGWMRAMPGVGALVMSLLIAHLPPMRNAGKSLLCAVSAFGVTTIFFGLSTSFWLSLPLLFLLGAFDTISVVVRGTLVQLLTPDEMRGRVSAVNNVFIGSSNEIGAFESGMTAAWFGPVISVVGGGIGTLIVVFMTIRAWPQLLKLGALASLKPVSKK